MLLFSLIGLLCFLTANLCVAAVPRDDVVSRSRNAPGTTDRDTIRALGHALTRARAENNQHSYSFNTTPLAKAWSNATLFTTGDETSYSTGSTLTSASIEIVCSTCYFNGSVSGELVLDGDFNFTSTVEDVWSTVSNVTETAWKTLEDHYEEAAKEVMEFDFSDIKAWPTIDVDFSLKDVDDLPEAHVNFQFDDLEMYLDLDIKLAAQSTYTINIFTTETPFGVSFTDLTLGLVFSVNLILIADAEVEIQSGIHIKIDEGLGFNLGLFDGNVSKTEVPGGSFEFLPITIDGLGSIQAILSLQATLGVDMTVPSVAEEILGAVATKLSAGISTDVFAYLADFQITVNGTTDASDDECDLSAVAEYSMAVGAEAGATVAIDNWMWGPQPGTTIPVWYTTLASVCAMNKTSSATPTSAIVTVTATSDSTTSTGTRQEMFSSVPVVTARANLHRRDSMTTTAVSTVESFTIVGCSETGIVNCPASMQYTSSFSRTVTADVTVQSGATATFPASTYSTVTSAIAFGSNMHRLGVTSGSPTSYVPTASAGSSSSSGHSSGTNDKLIIGLSVGLGAPALIGVFAAAAFLLRKRRQYLAVDPYPDTIQSLPPMHANSSMGTPSTMQVSPLITPRDF